MTILESGSPDFMPRTTPQGDMDHLLTTSTAVSNLTWSSGALALNGIYRAILVRLSPAYADTFLVQAWNAQSPVIFNTGFARRIPQAQVQLFPLAFGNAVGDSLFVSITAAVGGAQGHTVDVYGLRDQPMQLRGDLRPRPMGLFTASGLVTTAGASVTLASVPGAFGTCRVLLSSAQVLMGQSSAGNAFTDLQVTQNNVALDVITMGTTTLPDVNSLEWPEGILCDIGASVVYSESGGGGNSTARANITYDLVL